MPSLDFALCLGMIWCSARVLHTFVLQPLSQFSGDVAGTVVAEQSWLMNDMHLITTRRLQCEVQRIRDVFGPHICAKLPSNDIAAVIIQDCAEIEPPPAQNLEVSEIRLPKLVDRCGFVFELAGCLDHDEGRAGD